MIEVQVREQDVQLGPAGRRCIATPSGRMPVPASSTSAWPLVEAHLDARRVAAVPDGVGAGRGDRAAASPDAGLHQSAPSSGRVLPEHRDHAVHLAGRAEQRIRGGFVPRGARRRTPWPAAACAPAGARRTRCPAGESRRRTGVAVGCRELAATAPNSPRGDLAELGERLAEQQRGRVVVEDEHARRRRAGTSASPGSTRARGRGSAAGSAGTGARGVGHAGSLRGGARGHQFARSQSAVAERSRWLAKSTRYGIWATASMPIDLSGGNVGARRW